MAATFLADPSAQIGELASRLSFPSLLDQRGRMLQVSTALPTLALVPERMVLREAVGQGFELLLDCLSTSAHFELKLLIGEQITLRLLQADGAYRPMHGYVLEAAQLGADGGVARYRVAMRPWTAFLEHRRDSFVFQDKTAQAIIEDVFSDHPQANFRFELTEPLPTRSLCCQYRESDFDFVTRLLAEEGLSWRIEHLSDEAAANADKAGHARHVMVITDRGSARSSLGPVRFARQHAVANVAGQRDAVTAFEAARRVQPNAVARASWNYKQLAGSAATDSSSLELGELPALELYDGSGAYRYADVAQAERAASLALAALELSIKHFEGQGSARHFEAGRTFELVDHPLYGANTSTFNYTGALTASRARTDNAFTLLAVEHHATNNLGSQAAELLGLTALERGTYRNHFHAAPAVAAVVPRFIRKPTAPGLQTALVVGVEQDPLTTERDHRVKLQFPWQRGVQPLAGGLAHDERSADKTGNAPGNQQSGTWVRVALPAAGANWGAVFTPRIGTEVAIDYIEGDIDRPLIVGQLYNGADTPPFSAGVDSGVNHPGVISGVHSHSLDGSGFNQWVVDDASGQLRMRLHCSYTAAEVGLGHLVQQSGSSAQRGAWRGQGFEAGTQGWASLRAAQGLLISTSARAGSYGSAQGTQMDAAEAVAQLRAARDLGQRLSDAAKSSTAHSLASHHAAQAVEKLINTLAVDKDGKHPGPVNGQDAKKAGADGRSLAGPVEAFATPVILLDTPSTALWSSEAQIASHSGQDTSLIAQGDLHQAAAHTHASVSGQTTSWFTHEGGIKAYAANGPVSLRAHTDELQILADKDVTVISVNDEIHINANTRIELIGGQSSLVLDGGDITFTCPGQFSAKGSGHAFLAGGSGAAEMPFLPQGVQTIPTWIEINHRDADSQPMAGQAYKVFFEGGAVIAGKLDAKGHARHDNVPEKAVRVEYEPRTPEKDKPWDPLDKLVAAATGKLG